MVAACRLSDLLQMCEQIGLAPIPVTHPPFYAWVDSTPEENVLYIGKASSRRRTADEARWQSLSNNVGIDDQGRLELRSGIVALLAKQHARVVHLQFRSATKNSELYGLSKSRLARAASSIASQLATVAGSAAPASADIKEWLLAELSQLDEDAHEYLLTQDEVEKILIRIVVRSGAVISNSQYAGLWQSMLGTAADTVALLAVELDALARLNPNLIV